MKLQEPKLTILTIWNKTNNLKLQGSKPKFDQSIMTNNAINPYENQGKGKDYETYTCEMM